MGVVLLEPYRTSQSDTIIAAQQLLAVTLRPNGAIGLAYVVQRPGRDYSVIIAGEPRVDPIEAVFMSGMCDVLKADLENIIRGKLGRPR